MRLSWFILVCFLITLVYGQPTFNVLDFGAKGDGVTNDTDAIQAAILKASSVGGGIVLLPSTYTFFSASLFLKSDIVFRIETGATLLGSPYYDDYPFIWRGEAFGTSRASLITGGVCLELAPSPYQGISGCNKWETLNNVVLDGGGTVNGQGSAWWYAFGPAVADRPTLIEPMWVTDLVIRDLTFIASPSWTVHPQFCTNVFITNITVLGDIAYDMVHYDSLNVDGVDPESCTNVTLSNSWLRAGDDCVAINARHPGFPTENVVIDNILCHTPISIGSGTNAWIRNVVVKNSVVVGNWGNDTTYKPQWWHTALRLKTARGRGGGIENVIYSNITGFDVDLIFDFQMYYPCQNSSGMHNYYLCRDFELPANATFTPAYKNITFENIIGINTWRPGWLNCLPEMPCTDINFRNVQIDSNLDWVCDYVNGDSENVVPSPGDCLSGGPSPFGKKEKINKARL